MSAAKHTPGPWGLMRDHFPSRSEEHGIEVRPRAILGEKGRPTNVGWSAGYAPLARVQGDKRLISDEVRIANARLIAAAPELLEALQGFLDMYIPAANSGDWGNWDPEEEPEIIAARAAIAKATGSA